MARRDHHPGDRLARRPPARPPGAGRASHPPGAPPALRGPGPRRLRPVGSHEVLDYGIGLTDICKTRSGSDQEVGREAFDVPRLIAELERYSPAWIAFNGKNAARVALGRTVEYGDQQEALGGVPCFVLP